MEKGICCMSSGRWGLGSILQLKRMPPLFSRSHLSQCWHRLVHSYQNSIPLSKSLLSLCPEAPLLFLVKLIWVAELMRKPSAQLLTPHLLPLCCVLLLFGHPGRGELPLLIPGLVRGTSVLVWGLEAVTQPAGGIFCFGCMVNSNNMSFIAQNVSTFLGCYI